MDGSRELTAYYKGEDKEALKNLKCAYNGFHIIIIMFVYSILVPSIYEKMIMY